VQTNLKPNLGTLVLNPPFSRCGNLSQIRLGTYTKGINQSDETSQHDAARIVAIYCFFLKLEEHIYIEKKKSD